MSKIRIGISSCLLGNNVRYDGGNKLDTYILDIFGPGIEWVPVCPEVESGMPVPREPMQLVGDVFRPRLITIETRRDRTDALTGWIKTKVRELEQSGLRGFVFKARSPCTPQLGAELFGTSAGRATGLFAEAVLRCFPSLPVEDEEGLRDVGKRKLFLSQILL